MNHNEQDEQPGEDVVNKANYRQSSQQILDRFQYEGRYRCQTGMVSGAHQNQPRDDDDDDHHPATCIGQSLHRSIQVFLFRMAANQQIEFNLRDSTFYIRPGQKVSPVRMKTGEEGQVKPPDGQKDEKPTEENMDKTHIAHEKFIYSFSLVYRERIGDIEAGHNQNKYGDSHGPVVNPHGSRPLFDTQIFLRGCLHGHPLSHFEFFNLIRFRINDMNRAGHTRIKRMDRADNFQWLINFCQLGADK
jgi:hypothetical protein